MNQAPLPLKPTIAPADPSLWPLAPGWWLLLALIIVGVIAGGLFWRNYRQRRAAKRWLLSELNALRADTRAIPQKAQQINQLFKRWSLSQGARPGLSGSNWIDYLQQQSGHPLPEDARQLLQLQAYQKQPQIDESHFNQALETLIAVAHKLPAQGATRV